MTFILNSATWYNPDTDSDGVPNDIDNCPAVPNSDQSNYDNDLLGDACDPDFADADDDGIDDNCDACTDTDNDGYGNPGYPDNTCPDDNCPINCNSNQLDADADGIGDVCDPTPGCGGCGASCEIEC